jgi:hypothetical protein
MSSVDSLWAVAIWYYLCLVEGRRVPAPVVVRDRISRRAVDPERPSAGHGGSLMQEGFD